MEKKDHIIRCEACGTRNRIPVEQVGAGAKCGRCGHTLTPGGRKEAETDTLVLRCTQCGSRNRVPLSKVDAGPKCGKCGFRLVTEGLLSGEPLMITESNFEPEVLKSPLPTLLFAWAPWCPTCRASLPVIDDYAREAKGKVRVGKLNVDDNPNLGSRYNIMSVPQILVFDNGQLKETLPGAMQKHELMMKMSRYF